MMSFTDFYEWERAVEREWPDATLSDLGNPRGLRSYFNMKSPAGQREVARWYKNYNDGWVK